MSENASEHAARELLDVLPAIIAVATLGIGSTTAILGSGELTAIVFVVGWLLLTPLSAILGDLSSVQNRLSSSASASESTAATDDDEDALEALKRRYARGEIDEAEFERRTALLLENQSIDDVQSRVERERTRPTSTIDGRSDGRRDREREFES